MKSLILSLFFCVLSLSVFSADFEEGVKAARSKNWHEAEISFRKCLDKNPNDANALYNLGTTLAAVNHYPEAIWALEKSMKLDPKLIGARENLQFCYNKLNISDYNASDLSLFEQKVFSFGADNWTFCALISAFILAILIWFRMTSSNSSTRKISLIFGILVLCFMLLSLKNAIQASNYQNSDTHAIVLHDITSVFNDAQGNMKIDMSIKMGSRYKIDGISNNRIGIILQNQMIVWIDKSDLKLF
jgi:tetratricopeptide (TPR) repeat protein